MTPKVFLSIILLRINQNQPNFAYPSMINKKSVESLKCQIVLKMWGRKRRKFGKVCQKQSFLAVCSKIWSKTPSNKKVAIET